MKHNRNPLALAIHTVLGAGAVAGLALTAAPVAAQEDEEAAALDRVQVVGTRIMRTDIEGALPVTVIDREQIELSGKTSVADLLRNTPFNSAGSFRPQSGSSGQSFAGVSLRALGVGRTLVLVDGRRLPVAPNFGSGQNLNTIPLAAVERIEMLTDGASAIYGTDAIAGVINIVTRKDFTGAEVMVGMSNPKRAGGDTQEGSAVVGVAGDRGNLMMGVGYNKRDIVWQRDREWSTGGASVFSNNFRVANPAPGTPLGFTVGGFGFDPANPLGNLPPSGVAVPGAGCEGPGFFSNPVQCFYDFTLLAADEAEVQNKSVFARGYYELTPDHGLYMNASVFRVQTFGRYAPVPSSPFPNGAPFLPVGTPNHPATPPEQGGNNPDWQDYQQFANIPLFFAHRFAAGGPRDTDTDEHTYDFNVGIEGRIGQFDYDLGARYNESQYYDLGRNYVVGGLAQQFITNGQYNIYDPFGVDPAILRNFTTTINRDSRFRQREVYGHLATDVLELPAGWLSVAVGAEYRDEKFGDIYDSLSEAGQVVGSAGNSAQGDRDIWAAFVEILVPVTEQIELTFAGRYDDYSDYGSDFSPKIAARYQPMDEITFRASWGEGFRAPPLDILSAQPTFSANAVIHQPTCDAFGVSPCVATQVTNWVISNPDLGSEQSEQWAIGMAFEPLDWLSGSIDYWNVEITDRVASIGPQQVLNCVTGATTNCPPGLSVLPANVQPPAPELGLGVAFNPDGSILYLQRGFASLGTIKTEGFDFNTRTNFNFGEAGILRNNLQATYTRRYRTDAGNNVAGQVGLPRWRATLSNSYAFADFQFAWNINYIHNQTTAADPGQDRTGSWTTHDLQANWYTPWNGRVTLGVDNIADRDPIIDFGFGRGFNFSLYNGYGRVPYIRYTQNF